MLHIWHDTARPAAWNMAADETLHNTADHPILRIYKWSEPAVTIGRSQLYPANIPAGHAIIRRPTGGGIVWHTADLTYTLALPAEHPITRMDISASYALIHERIRAALPSPTLLHDARNRDPSPRTMSCFASPSRHDIMAGDGAKIAGAAELRSARGLLVQGSVSLAAAACDWDAARAAILRAFAASASPLASDAIPFLPSPALLVSIDNLAASKYAADAWNRHGNA